jgi:hypothetical protein
MTTRFDPVAVVRAGAEQIDDIPINKFLSQDANDNGVVIVKGQFTYFQNIQNQSFSLNTHDIKRMMARYGYLLVKIP